VSFPRTTAYRAQEELELTHGDLCGPISPVTSPGNKYFIFIMDDASRYMWVELVKTKDGALKFFRKIKALAENDMKEICPRGNNNIVIIIFLVHDNVYIPC
jgi:hypothetical protein